MKFHQGHSFNLKVAIAIAEKDVNHLLNRSQFHNDA